MSEADRRLHAAKRGGRDRVVASAVPTGEDSFPDGRRRYRDRRPGSA